MRMFLLGFVVMIGLGVGGYFALSTVQEPVDVAFTDHFVRVDPAEAPGEHRL